MVLVCIPIYEEIPQSYPAEGGNREMSSFNEACYSSFPHGWTNQMQELQLEGAAFTGIAEAHPST